MRRRPVLPFWPPPPRLHHRLLLRLPAAAAGAARRALAGGAVWHHHRKCVTCRSCCLPVAACMLGCRQLSTTAQGSRPTECGSLPALEWSLLVDGSGAHAACHRGACSPGSQSAEQPPALPRLQLRLWPWPSTSSEPVCLQRRWRLVSFVTMWHASGLVGGVLHESGGRGGCRGVG